MRFKIKSKCPYCGGTAVYTDETNEISCTQCGYTVAGADGEDFSDIPDKLASYFMRLEVKGEQNGYEN